MKKAQSLFLIIFFTTLSVKITKAQDTIPQAGGTCNEAVLICNKNTVVVSSDANGSSDPTADAIRANSPSCFDKSRNQSTFLKFVVKKTGMLNFTIKPVDNATEYDWAIYEFTGCGDNLQNPPGEIACNYYDNHKASSPGPETGMSSTGAANGSEPFGLEIQVDAGITYLLLIDNYWADGKGYELSWGGSFDIAPPMDFTVNGQALPDTICCAPANVTFQNMTTYPGSFTWDFGNGQTSSQQDPPAQTYTAGTYQVLLEITTADACVYQIQKTIIIKDTIIPEPEQEIYLYVPNAFTPDGDGMNDEFKATGSGLIEFHMVIYNRWGNRVFSSEALDEGWKGGDKIPGVYIYRILARDVEDQTYERTGTVSLLK